MAPRVDTEADLGKVRHIIDLASLENYLVTNYPADFAKPLALKQFGFGQSNPSYQVTDAYGRKYVVRKKPSGQLISKTAHAVDREFYMLKALKENTKVPVPKVIGLCQDPAVIGTDFYVMEFIEGRIFHRPSLPELSVKDREECWHSALATLANLHSIDPSTIGLPAMFTKRMESHYARQLVTLTKVAKAQAAVKDIETGELVGPIPDADRVVTWMSKHLPSPRVAIVHGDYKIDNLIFHSTENRVIAILDWELCTIGHPLADLCNLLSPYYWPESLFGKDFGFLNPKETLPKGLPTVEQNLQYYSQIAGWDPVPSWTFGMVSAHYRFSVICHGIKARVARRQASSASAASNAEKLPSLAILAVDAIDESNKGKL